MGYYTDYNLSFDTSIDERQEVFDYIDETFGEYIDEDGYTNSKWYHHVDNMRNVSIKFPDVLFTLSGEGEDNGDLWKKYFKNGKVQACYAEIVYPEFNENLME